MIKLIKTLIILIIIYFVISLILTYFKTETQTTYTIKYEKTKLNVIETANFTTNTYNFKITANNEFNFQIIQDYKKQEKIITEIYYYNDEYECIIPIFKNEEILIDMICIKDNFTTYYHNINDEKINKFVKNLNILNDEISEETIKLDSIQIYQDNLITSHYISLTNYTGIYKINNEFENIKIYDKDQYDHNLSIYIDKYFISPNYNQNYNFNEFLIYDITSSDTKTLKLNDNISYNSYIQGVVDNTIYLFDKENNIQYEINENKVTKNNEIKHYNNGIWETITTKEAKENKQFTYANETKENYYQVDEINNELYLYENINNQINVYKQTNNQIKFLFQTESIENINYINNYLYFSCKDTIYIYSEKFGIKPILKYSELDFNKNIKLYIYGR